MVRAGHPDKLRETSEKILDSLLAKSNTDECGVDNMSLIVIKLKQ